jgi:hypothetical protein
MDRSPNSTALTERKGASPDLRIEVLFGRDALEALNERWDELLVHQPVPSPTLSSDWLRSLHGPDGAMAILVFRESRLVSGAAFRRARAGPMMIGTWFGGARMPGLLADSRVAVGADAVVRTALEHCHFIWLPRTPVGSPTWEALRRATPWRRASPVSPGGWIVELPPPRLEHARDKAAYGLRRAGRKGAEIRIRVVNDTAGVNDAFDRLVHLYRARWAGREDEGNSHSDIVLESNRYHRLLPVLARKDRVRIVEVLEDERLVASILGLLVGRGALFHTTATEPDGALRGPGHVAMLAWVEEAMRVGADVMYLGRGAGDREGPKARLGARELALVDVRAASTPGRQHAIDAVLRAARPIRRLRRRMASAG